MWTTCIVHLWTYVCVLSILSVTGSSALCSSAYGAEPCLYIPAPPGKTPACARPGDTFCEHVEHYPMQHIRYLIDKWGYDYSTLFSDETRDEFNTYFSQPDYHYGYPNSISHQTNNYPNHGSSGYTYPEPIYIPKPPPGREIVHYPQQHQQSGISNKYIPPLPSPQLVTSNGVKDNCTDSFQGYADRRPKYPGYQQGNGVNHGFRGHHHGYFMPPQMGYHQGQQMNYFDPNNWWRYARDNKYALSLRTKRSALQSAPKKPLKSESENKNATSGHQRNKRQSPLGGSRQLCPTRSDYIMPRAALNNKGNWMYVVNLQEQDNRYTQLVRSEQCVSQTCSGLCSIPSGYTARCEQRYVQKRLVALEGAGQNLYTDVFWFPSCCICTFTTG